MLESVYQKNCIEAGVDEAGRGCYAGPVFAAAVILPPDFYHPFLNDSKLLTEKQRNILRPIIEKESISYSVSSVCNKVIDDINILQASYKAMHLAIDKLQITPEHLIIDGNSFKPYYSTNHTCIVKGDGKYASIAAASILAKTYRDEYMTMLSKEIKHYGWERNKGYGTKLHRDAIQKFGLCQYHRMSFNIA